MVVASLVISALAIVISVASIVLAIAANRRMDAAAEYVAPPTPKGLYVTEGYFYLTGEDSARVLKFPAREVS